MTKLSNEALRNLIVKFALEQNTAELDRLKKQSYWQFQDIFFSQNVSPIKWLAQQNKDAAVIFLLTHFNADIRFALLGAIQGNHFFLLKNLLTKYPNYLDFVSRTIGLENKPLLVDQLRNAGFDIDVQAVIAGAAAGKHFSYLNTLIDKNVPLDQIIFTIKSNKLNSFDNQTELLFFISFINSSDARKNLLNEIKISTNKNIEVDHFLFESEKLNKLIQRFKISDIDQLKALLSPEIFPLFAHEKALQHNILPLAIYIEIVKYVFKLPIKQTLDLFNTYSQSIAYQRSQFSLTSKPE